MRRGDVFMVDFDPAAGSEANKVRPAVLVSNNAANKVAEQQGRGVVTVVPVTSNTARVHPFQVLIRAGDGGLVIDSKAQAEQIRSVDVRRLRRRLGNLKEDTVRSIDDALRVHLST
ncbi:type II toxin-antitoxin system PemK/MazF family toxin [Dactylosporangium sp. NPDC000521]|uniref:type II toxin-antitoxin system PemK/MazF family toxin n=1 Tax=Dactylosporangium sp. NPDC000521 TaxID=3363975 RepID=UPI00367BB3E7